MIHDDRKCSRCESARTRIIAHSATPPGVFLQCRDCGFSTLAPIGGAPPAGQPPIPDAADKRRMERIVNAIISENRLLCRLMSVDAVAAGWRVVVRTRIGASASFEFPADSLSLMKASIERALGTET